MSRFLWNLDSSTVIGPVPTHWQKLHVKRVPVGGFMLPQWVVWMPRSVAWVCWQGDEGDARGRWYVAEGSAQAFEWVGRALAACRRELWVRGSRHG